MDIRHFKAQHNHRQPVNPEPRMNFRCLTLTTCCCLIAAVTGGASDIDALWSQPAGGRGRASSWDQTGANTDYTIVASNQTLLLFKSEAAGVIERIWLTVDTENPRFLRDVRVNMDFDGENTVALVGLGMFTGTGPWRVNDLRTPALNIMRARKLNAETKGVGTGSFNIHWAMPFARSARVELSNRGLEPVKVFFQVEYLLQKHDTQPLLFHADHHVASPTTLAGGPQTNNTAANFLILEKRGFRGKYVGTILCVESHPDRPGKWYEGDDMFVIDDEPWPPRLHGTGTEDYFGMAWGVHREYQACDHGVSHYERNLTDHDRFYDGRFVLYRLHLNDPIPFYRSIQASIEAGSGNDCAQHYESVAFWYGARNQ
jgi:hypothetical protein